MNALLLSLLLTALLSFITVSEGAIYTIGVSWEKSSEDADCTDYEEDLFDMAMDALEEAGLTLAPDVTAVDSWHPSMNGNGNGEPSLEVFDGNGRRQLCSGTCYILCVTTQSNYWCGCCHCCGGGNRRLRVLQNANALAAVGDAAANGLRNKAKEQHSIPCLADDPDVQITIVEE